MSTLHALWLLDTAGTIILSRRFPTVARHRHHGGDEIQQIPSDAVFSSDFHTTVIGPRERERERRCGIAGFTEQDSLAAIFDSPLDSEDLHSSLLDAVSHLTLATLPSLSTPVVFIQRDEMYLAAAPDVDSSVEELRTRLIDLPEITSALYLLIELVPLIVPIWSKLCEAVRTRGSGGTPDEECDAAVDELHSMLAVIMPFGTPVDTANAAVTLRHVYGPKDELGSSRQPEWKPVVAPPGGRQRLDFLVREEMRCAQYDKKVADVVSLYGEVWAKADVGGIPDITVPLVHPDRAKHVTVHHCVQSPQTATPSELCFTPPAGSFVLFRFQTMEARPPLRGFYQMKQVSPNQAKILLQLKLESWVANSFEYCNAVLPFPNRGTIVRVDLAPSAGAVTIQSDKKSLKWALGTRFTARNLQVALPGTVTFSRDEGDACDATEDLGNFLSGQNAFVWIEFAVAGFAASGITVDTKNIKSYPVQRLAAGVEHKTVAPPREYVIWNSRGDVHHVPEL